MSRPTGYYTALITPPATHDLFYFPRQPLMRRTDSVPLSWVAIGKEAREGCLTDYTPLQDTHP
ncbi:uncharacterized protein TrAtP1_007624 [Trichoderma atroviride]|uniref:uncharacterized protein n=1 Tax=Hypocrea atroviridis TaxID=63577 RepID=UPI00332A4F2B|nr:hypothetical protein TrAtP1_007624 [Trichoderma atroviride]